MWSMKFHKNTDIVSMPHYGIDHVENVRAKAPVCHRVCQSHIE